MKIAILFWGLTRSLKYTIKSIITNKSYIILDWSIKNDYEKFSNNLIDFLLFERLLFPPDKKFWI